MPTDVPSPKPAQPSAGFGIFLLSLVAFMGTIAATLGWHVGNSLAHLLGL